MNPDIPQYGRPEMFLTRQQHLDFRAVTHLLFHTQAIEESESDMCGPGHISKDMKSKLDLFKNFSRITIRDTEVIALVNKSYTPDNHPSVTILKQPDQIEVDISGLQEADTFQPPVANKANNVTALSASFAKEDIGDLRDTLISTYYLKNLRIWKNYSQDTISRVGVQKLYPFSYDKHCQIILKLLRRAWDQKNTRDDRVNRKFEFRSYILLASNSAILSQFAKINASRILIYLDIEASDPQLVANSCLPVTSKARTASILPTKSQLKLFTESVRKHWIDMGCISKADSEQLFRDLRIKPLNDLGGRLRFHSVFKSAYKAAFDSLKKLQNELSDNTPTSEMWTASTELTAAYTQSIYMLLYYVWESFRLWYIFIQEFKDNIRDHLVWWSRIFKPESGYEHSSRDQDYDMTSLADTCEYYTAINSILPPLNQEQESTLHKVIRSFVANFEFRIVNISSTSEYPDREMTKPADLLSTLRFDGKALTENENRDIIVWLGKNANIQDGVSQVVNAEGVLGCTRFNGTYHCESSSMALFFLAHLKSSEYIENSLGDTAPDKGLLLPSRDVIQHYKTMSHRILISGKCCASCWCLMEQFNRALKKSIWDGDAQLTIHARDSIYRTLHMWREVPAQLPWIATDLPPWLLKEHAEAVIEVARELLTTRITAILEQMQSARDEVKILERLKVAPKRTADDAMLDYDD